MVGARTLKFGMQKATAGDYQICDLQTNRTTTDETGRSFPFLKVPMDLDLSYYIYFPANFSRIILSSNILLPSIIHLLTN